MPLPSIARLEQISAASLAAFRESLRRHGFCESVIDAVDHIATGAPGNVRLPIVRAQLGTMKEPAMQLALLLTYGGRLERSEVMVLLGVDVTEALVDAGLLLPLRGGLRCPFRIVPIEAGWILSDHTLDEPDSVMPPGPTTGQMIRIMPRPCPSAVLDVGCGPGSMALVAAARGASRVVGTDINPRAIAMARFNARWLELEAEFRVGDLLEPVAGERFDLVVAQPPFVTQPPGAAEIRFLHGGPTGDVHLLRLLKGLAGCLMPSSEALVLSDVALKKDTEMGDYLRDAVGSCGLELLVLHLAGPSLDTHVLAYSLHDSIERGGALIQEVLRHREHLAAIGVAKLRHALFVARPIPADSASALVVAVAMRDVGSATPEVRARLWASARGAQDSDEALLGRRIRVSPDAQWISFRRSPEGEQSEHRVRFGDQWPALEQIVTDEGLMLASLLERADRVDQAIAGYAELCDSTPAEVRAPLLGYIRNSLLNGMLVFEENGRGD